MLFIFGRTISTSHSMLSGRHSLETNRDARVNLCYAWRWNIARWTLHVNGIHKNKLKRRRAVIRLGRYTRIFFLLENSAKRTVCESGSGCGRAFFIPK
jgi:hypothetical protein